MSADDEQEKEDRREGDRRRGVPTVTHHGNVEDRQKSGRETEGGGMAVPTLINYIQCITRSPLRVDSVTLCIRK